MRRLGADTGSEASCRARDWYARHWHGPTFLAVGARDPVPGTCSIGLLALVAWMHWLRRQAEAAATR
ncbi:hypothetical protein [Pseudorhodoferax sp. Leaf267]|uniref:hypothetical protein n=1 Tax=Pseudorhodoferax sp. Leaf267 TaxID=1736316 RepID=UPI0006F287DE|nr:hypothetical protein [Pseudorhodoferax sp. Leaf267]